MNSKTALITGATSGFGKSIAQKFASNGWNIIITGRRKERLQKLVEELTAENDILVHALHFDVRNRSDVNNALSSLPKGFEGIDLLVNNAGLASGKDLFQEADVEDWDRMIDTNVKGLLYVTKAALPYLFESANPHIINIGSTAGKEVYQGGSVYCASKYAVNALSQGMRIDLLKDGVKVTQICPGLAETEFSLVRFKGDAEKASSVYDGYEPLYANDIADIAWYAANTPPHVCLNDIVVTPTAQANSVSLHRNNS